MKTFHLLLFNGSFIFLEYSLIFGLILLMMIDSKSMSYSMNFRYNFRFFLKKKKNPFFNEFIGVFLFY